MDGYVKMIKEVMDTILIIAVLLKEAFAYMIPGDFAVMVRYYWEGVSSMGNWAGYALAAG